MNVKIDDEPWKPSWHVISWTTWRKSLTWVLAEGHLLTSALHRHTTAAIARRHLLRPAIPRQPRRKFQLLPPIPSQVFSTPRRKASRPFNKSSKRFKLILYYQIQIFPHIHQTKQVDFKKFFSSNTPLPISFYNQKSNDVYWLNRAGRDPFRQSGNWTAQLEKAGKKSNKKMLV